MFVWLLNSVAGAWNITPWPRHNQRWPLLQRHGRRKRSLACPKVHLLGYLYWSLHYQNSLSISSWEHRTQIQSWKQHAVDKSEGRYLVIWSGDRNKNWWEGRIDGALSGRGRGKSRLSDKGIGVYMPLSDLGAPCETEAILDVFLLLAIFS